MVHHEEATSMGGKVVSNEEICSSESLRHFFLEYKYRGAVKRLANGITHSYNNIFTGLAGQLSMHLRDGDHSQQYKKRREQIDSLLQRGVQQTGLFFEFCRFKPEEYKINSPGRIAERAVDLLNSLSRLHHVEVFIDRGAPAIASKFNDLVLMLFYLGENAFEAMAEGGLARLEVRAGKDHQGRPRVTFAVIDGGHGFSGRTLTPEKRSAEIFQRRRPGAFRSGAFRGAGHPRRSLRRVGNRKQRSTWHGNPGAPAHPAGYGNR
jgi:signal transduction histidine kinase